VLNDLVPYVCTFEGCELFGHLFKSRDQWNEHEAGHRTEFCCNADGHLLFDEEGPFLSHMRQEYGMSSASSQDHTVLDMFRRPSKEGKVSGVCCLCGHTARRLKKHLSRHLEQIALFALPRNTELNDKDSHIDSNFSVQMKGTEASDSESGASFTSAQTVFKDRQYGLFVLSEPTSLESRPPENMVDIVAIHGYGGGFDSTWNSIGPSGQQVNFLRHLLPETIPNSRILSFGYDSKRLIRESGIRLSAIGKDLLIGLESIRKSSFQRVRPLIFICHCIGGIIFKDASFHRPNWSTT
jgi:hypothetical protein